MNEINALMEKSHRYLRSAELLWRDSDSSSAASRLYYAMFFSAEAVLLTKDYSHLSHKGVLSSFGKHFVKTVTLRYSAIMGSTMLTAPARQMMADSFPFCVPKTLHTERMSAERWSL